MLDWLFSLLMYWRINGVMWVPIDNLEAEIYVDTDDHVLNVAPRTNLDMHHQA